MEIEPGFASKCDVTIGGRVAQVKVQESSIVAEVQDLPPGSTGVAMMTPEHISPAALRGHGDTRMLGLALLVTAP